MSTTSAVIAGIFIACLFMLAIFCYRKVYYGTRIDFRNRVYKLVNIIYMKDRKLADYEHYRGMIAYNIYRMESLLERHGNCATRSTVECVSDNYLCEELTQCLDTTPRVKEIFIELLGIYDEMPNADLSAEDLVEDLKSAFELIYVPSKLKLPTNMK